MQEAPEIITGLIRGSPVRTSGRATTLFNILAWFSVFAAILATTPDKAAAAREKSVRKEPAKGKSFPPAPLRRLTNAPSRSFLKTREMIPDADPLDKREHVVYHVRSGETLTAILNRFRLAASEKQLWGRSIRQNLGSASLTQGKEIHFYFAKGTGQGGSSLKAVELDHNEAVDLTWEKGSRGILFQRREKPFNVEIKTAVATVDGSLFDSGFRAGIQPALLSQFADIFTWDVDLEKDIQKGDSFRILYEQRSRKGESTKPLLRILAAELINVGQKMTAIYFEKQKGIGGYYNLEGRSLARSFLRFPLEFTSITSRFTESRFHPMLKANMPHTGVDFAAQRGTPVRAVGDGVITQAGWNGSYGKLVEIQHDSTYTTRYAHLGTFAEGVVNGTKVSKGQVIGFVGSTGRSTGPHLHFELYKDQQYVNPLSVEFPADETIEPSLQRLFDNQKKIFLVGLTSSPQS